MGSGKTSVGIKIASLTGLKFEDLDERIVRDSKTQIKDIFAKFGEDYFRKLETKTAKKVLKPGSMVVSTGGGIVTRPENFVVLKKGGTVVYLKNSFAVCARRLRGCIDRPLFDSANLGKTEKLFKMRQKFYDKAADITVNTGKMSVLQAAKEVIKKAGIKVEKNKA